MPRGHNCLDPYRHLRLIYSCICSKRLRWRQARRPRLLPQDPAAFSHWVSRCDRFIALELWLTYREDGGGVRGLSSLLILQSLMGYVNSELRKLGRTHDTISDLRPHDVFDLVVGTSTGGLIAILLGKLGLTPEECIRTYNDLSKRIFGKKHLRGRFSRGLAYPKYSGRRLEQCVCDLLKDRGYSETTPMMFNNDVDKMAW